MSNILGFQSGHDVSYFLMNNGQPLIHEELERFSRVKEELGDGLKLFFDMQPKDKCQQIKYFTFGNFGGRTNICKEKTIDNHSDEKMERLIQKNRGKFFELSHHMTHAANAFFSSNFDDSLILTIDGGGWESDGTQTCATIYKGSNKNIEKIKVYSSDSLNIGNGWNYIAKLFGLSTGFPKGNQAGTVMAMASMSNSTKYTNQLIDLMSNFDTMVQSADQPQALAKKLFNKVNFSEKDKFDISSCLQQATELLVRAVLDEHMAKYKPKNLCVSGGCALNSVLIGKIQSWYRHIDEIYVPPVPYDSGLAIGSAQYLWHQILGKERIKWVDNFSPYLGRKYSEFQVLDATKKFAVFLKTEKVDDNHILNLLNEQKIVSVFGGGSESGRRALGNRSILADPRNPKMKDLINEEVKHRQWFRPFAPSILREKVGLWFENDVSSPYMSHIIKWKKNVIKQIPAVVHFDGSARLQTVTEKDNFWYYNFLRKWEKISSVPILLNTSFNDSEPIVETPMHAINCFLKTKINYLYFFDHNILISK